MSDLNLLFRKRIGIPSNELITFDHLDNVLEKAATAIPFENLCIMEKRTNEITKENLINKIIHKNEGGLCYELNSLLHLFLVENGFDVSIIRAVIYDHKGGQWNTIGKTHVTNILHHDGLPFLVDTGFGGNLPLKPVPLNGETVISRNGEFRVEKANSPHGDYIFYLKLSHKDTDWKIGYAFDSKKVIESVTELNEVQTIILEHQDSPFNKSPLLTRLTEKGNMTLTETSFTEWADGREEKKAIDQERFKEMIKEQFGIQTT